MTLPNLNGKQFINTKNDYYYVNTLEINIRIILQPVNPLNWIGNDSELPSYRSQSMNSTTNRCSIKKVETENYETHFLFFTTEKKKRELLPLAQGSGFLP